MISKTLKKEKHLPEFGKKQIDLDSWNIDSCKIFIIYLPCASKKPYYLSSTHSYLKQKLEESFPQKWLTIIQFCTISEVLGVVPEDLEDVIFNDKNGNFKIYNYEHYPTHRENDILNTRKWLKTFLREHKGLQHFAYNTSKIFREICTDIQQLDLHPKNFNPSSALFEFRKKTNIKKLSKVITEEYYKILQKRLIKWSIRNNNKYLLLKTFCNYNSFGFSEIKEILPFIKNPYKLVYELYNEGNYGRGIFLKRLERGRYCIIPELGKLCFSPNIM